MECRIVCTQKRDGSMKARLVLKDLKVKRKLPDIKTYAAVPSHSAMRLLIAAADGSNALDTHPPRDSRKCIDKSTPNPVRCE